MIWQLHGHEDHKEGGGRRDGTGTQGWRDGFPLALRAPR
jgi:hypothetical protein